MRAKQFIIEIVRNKKKRKKKRSSKVKSGVSKYYYPGFGYYGYSGSSEAQSDGGDGGESIRENEEFGDDRNARVQDFSKWACEILHIKSPPKIELSMDTEEARNGKHTGRHVMGADEIWIYAKNRNMIDILRTVFHELVHIRQEELGMVKPGSSYPGSPIEAMADMLAGKWIKIYGKKYPQIFESSRSSFAMIREYKRDVTKQQLGDRLVAASQRDRQQGIDTILAELEAMDPTANKQYVLWLANQYIKGLFRLEDKPRVKDVLEKFINARSRLPEKDIGRYTFHSLEDEMDKVYNIELKPQQSADEPKTFEVPDNVDVLYNGPLGLLAVPKTKKASCELGSGTKWCTASREDNMFTYYNKQGPLYVWRDKNGDKYQLHFGKNDFQFMDDKDRPIKKALLNQFRTQHPVLKQLFKEKEAEIVQNPGQALNYASDVLNKRWPEAEAAIARNPELASIYARYVIKGRWPEAEAVIARKPEWAIEYAVEVLKKRWPEAEAAIARNPKWANDYARDVIKGRWPEGEKAIARDPDMAYAYTREVLKKRFPEAEAAIAQSPQRAYYYARDVIKGRWPEGEKAIARDPDMAYAYTREVLKKRFPEAEAAIAQSPQRAYEYARYVIKKRWPEGEEAIARDPYWAYYYARDVVKGRFPEGEAVIPRDPELAYRYARYVIKKRWPEGEKAIARDPEGAYEYARYVIEGRWPEAEPVIARDPEWAYYYAKDVIKGRWPEGEEAIARDKLFARRYKMLKQKSKKISKK